MRRARIGILQAEWSTDTETNLQKMESLVTRLHSEWGNRVNLLSFCEYAVTGFDPGRLRESAETIPGPATERLAQLARKTGYNICNGSMLERDGPDLFNTALIFNPEGQIVHRYRKTHPWCPPVGGEDICFGREFPVTDIPGIGKVGVMICYDAYFPKLPGRSPSTERKSSCGTRWGFTRGRTSPSRRRSRVRSRTAATSS